MAVTMSAQGRVPLIAGNWKMNLNHLQSIAFVQKLAWGLEDARHDFATVEVAVFPPFTDLRYPCGARKFLYKFHTQPPNPPKFPPLPSTLA